MTGGRPSKMLGILAQAYSTKPHKNDQFWVSGYYAPPSLREAKASQGQGGGLFYKEVYKPLQAINNKACPKPSEANGNNLFIMPYPLKQGPYKLKKPL